MPQSGKNPDEEFHRPASGRVGRHLAVLAKLGRRALLDISPQRLMDEVVALVAGTLGAEYGSVLELLPDGKVKFQAGVGWNEGLVGRLAFELEDRFPTGQVLLTREPVVIEDITTDSRVRGSPLFRDHGVVASVNVPIHGRSRPLGVLGVHTSKLRRFTDDELHFVQAVANILAGALERRRHQERERDRYEQRVEQMMALGQVAAGVAHELRNPLTAIKGLVQVNLRKLTAQGVPAEDLGVIDHEIRRMERSLQTFLDFARPAEPNRRRLETAPIVDRVSTLVAGRAKKQSVSFRFLQPDTPVWMEADQDQIQQLLLNLTLNALDAMPGGGTVEIDLRPPRDGWIELYVRDTGPGIAPHILPKVFDAFVSSKETGVGLGLPVSRRIAEDHGGTLSAYNLPGGGACVLFRLPALASQ